MEEFLCIRWDWVCRCWDWFVTGPDGRESGSTIIRNLGLLIGGLSAIVLAIWRNIISQRGLLNERYQKGAEMLGSGVLSVRLGGIYALQRLAQDNPKQYHVRVMRLFCAMVRHPTADTTLSGVQVREDVQAAMTAIANRSDSDVELEKKDDNFVLDVSDAFLPLVYLVKANLTDARLTGAKFYTDPAKLTVQEQDKSKKAVPRSCAELTKANLSNAFLSWANLTKANLSDANLSGATLVEANLTEAHFVGAKGLTQTKLNTACADPAKPPQLGGLRDAESGDLLKWRGQPCGE